MRRLTPALLVLLFSATSLPARVISYSPYTDRTAIPAHQLRTNRHFVLIEGLAPGMGGGIGPPMPIIQAPGMIGHLVVYDFLGLDEPEVVYPREGQGSFLAAAARENAAGVLSILALVSENNQWPARPMLSTDAGATWKHLDIPLTYQLFQSLPSGVDLGGPFAGGRGSQIRIGNEATPFVLSTGNAIYAIDAAGSARLLVNQGSNIQGNNILLIGSDTTGSRVLFVSDKTRTLNTADGSTSVVDAGASAVDGWITPDGAVYLEERTSSQVRVIRVRGGTRQTIVEGPLAQQLSVFGVPTFDYSGAWIIERGPGKPTSLYKHTATMGLQKQWEDITAPEVEALHAGSSGTKLLIQVHRPRPQADQRIFQDPALAVWKAGEAAPRVYDELYMDEQFNKGFVHLDVEKIESGEPFVFDSGVRFSGWRPGGVSPALPPSGGGGDVVQEWGVVRASLKQRLVLPAVGRTEGAYGSYWVTDVILYNPADAQQNVEIRFAPSGASTIIAQHPVRTVTLERREIRLIADALQSLFDIESGTGALFVEPESGISMTSRTYSQSATGTYGFGMHAIDVYAAAASARFPLTFSGAFLGNNYRTNVVITDAGEHGSLAGMRAAGTSGLMGLSGVAFEVAAKGQQQINSIAPMLGVWPYETGALLFQPSRGMATASVFATDNRTNDSTYFPPDLPAPIVRTIPAIGHVDGANNARFRSDLYLYNPANQVRTLMLQMQKWDTPETATLSFTMLPNEARVIRDVLQTAFGRTGFARLRYQSMDGDANGVRVTSRTYSEREDGGTYGFLMPPLNNFQSGGAGDTLEILGAVAHPDYRTNIGLVDLSAFATGQTVSVRIEIVETAGNVADSFTVNVPMAGGMQLNDVFHARSLEVSGPVLIRVSPLGGLVGAYATHIDNRTNDASYLAANLGAKD